ncbi:ketopantoate reductase family protein [Frigidibacter sp. ROC022]|uniref:ketopantoate reductase family protein n=1 Tax=Frigidibacter sp. ROC022 TaxID=2971796 RepID=UPI00215AB70C|nr:2-dehydropantoate 2-reductase N-terminal domain-containing protein [Frigidibacter sp. ROC022]MCR8724655.1 ketopantoate reductase family protein [Frigidibacter sp. ROC022]
MRVVAFGIGAIGGSIAARLALTGTEVIGIARGRMLDAVRRQGGLRVVSHLGAELAPVPVVASAGEVDWRPDDIILLTMKTNDTADALQSLLAAGVYRQPIICAQNGVANEPMALRFFPNVHGMAMLMPAQYTEPGTVVAFGKPKLGLLDIGRYPTGYDASVEPLATALDAAGFLCTPKPDVMQVKYGKLLLNLSNIVGAALGAKAQHGPWYAKLRAEAEAAYEAAGITIENVDADSPRRALMKGTPIPGIEMVGTSSVQSLTRGTGTTETDYFNGEIVLLGRQFGVPTPLNLAFTQIARKMVLENIAPGSLTDADVEAFVETYRESAPR